MIITDITVKDFLSLGDVHIQFPTSGLLLVSGWDEDLGRSNGAGKTSFFLALTWCVYGEYPRDIKVEELIRRGQTACHVTVNFDVNGTKYTVTRRRPCSIELTINGEKQKGNPKFLQALIDQAIGLSYKQFLIASYFPQNGDSSRFLNQNDATAKDFLSTILNFNKTELGYKKLHVELKELEAKLVAKKSEIATIESSIEKFKSLANSPVPEKPTREEVLAVKGEMTALDATLASPPDTSSVDRDIELTNQAYQKVQTIKYSVESTKRSVSDKEWSIKRLEEQETKHLVCPECSAELLESSGKLISFDEEAAAEIKKSKIDTLRGEIAELEEKVKKLVPVVKREAELLSKLDNLKASRLQARHDFDMAVQKRAHLATKCDGFRKASLASQQIKQRNEDVAKQVSDFSADHERKCKELQAMEYEVMLASAAKSVLSPTGAIAYSLDSVMADLNDNVEKYLDIFSHETMSYRITSGEDKAKVTHHLTKDGEEVSVGSLSGGEERGLILSVDLGLGEVIAQRSGVALPSVLMLDECFEGLDYIGKEKVLDALREIAKDRCIVIVDHSTEMNAMFDKCIKIIKKDGTSRVS